MLDRLRSRLSRAPLAAHLRRGRAGERTAARAMRRAGCRIVARNLDTPGGEADLVCVERASGTVVLVEVKTRLYREGSPELGATLAINADKRRRLAATARALAGHPRFSGSRVRIDVVTVERREGGPERVTHYANAVTAEGRLR